MTQAKAIQEVRAKGYTVQYDTGESGDCGYGSRLYFMRPAAERGDNGIPPQTATVSKVPGAGWLTSYFGDNNG